MKENNKVPWFSITKEDFDWSYFKSPGPGGSHKNKTSSAVRCIHRESGALGQASDHREQSRNKRLAFERCTATKRFQVWLKMEMSRRETGLTLEERVDRMLSTADVKVECRDEDGRWIIFEE